MRGDFCGKPHEDSMPSQTPRPSTIRVVGSCSYLSSFMPLGQQKVLPGKRMRVETECYIFFCQGWLVPSLGFFECKNDKVQQLYSLFCEVEWLCFSMIQPDMMWIWSKKLLPSLWKSTTRPPPPQWTVVMIHVTSSDLWRIWATLPWIQDYNFQQNCTSWRLDGFNCNSHVCHHLPWPRTEPTLRSCILYST